MNNDISSSFRNNIPPSLERVNSWWGDMYISIHKHIKNKSIELDDNKHRFTIKVLSLTMLDSITLSDIAKAEIELGMDLLSTECLRRKL